MRFIPTIAAMCLLPTFAFADSSVAGYWITDLGENVRIEMNLTADGQWNSSTHQGNELIAEMAGKYTQKAKSPDEGSLVFVPTKSFVTVEHGAPKTEHDIYRLSQNGQELTLTANGDALEFKKLTP